MSDECKFPECGCRSPADCDEDLSDDSPLSAPPTEAPLLPCPHCGSAKAKLHGGLRFIQCGDCGATGPTATSLTSAISNWNIRATPTVPVGFALVPIEPTPEMLKAGLDETQEDGHCNWTVTGPAGLSLVWDAMLGAKP